MTFIAVSPQVTLTVDSGELLYNIHLKEILKVCLGINAPLLSLR